MHPPFTNILLHQNRGSKDNKDCTCEFYESGNFKKANPACPVQGHSSAVNGVSFSADGSLVASCSGDFRGEDCSVRMWSVETGQELKKFLGHSAQINNVRFSLDGTMLASCSGSAFENDNSVRLWNVGTGEQLKKLEGHR